MTAIPIGSVVIVSPRGNPVLQGGEEARPLSGF